MWSTAFNLLLGLLGLLLLLATVNSVIRTLVVPRVASSRIAAMVTIGTLWVFTFIARRLKTYRRRDAALAFAGPMILIGLLVVWLGLYWLSYALLMQVAEGLTFAVALREAGSSLFTLGYATDQRAQLMALDFFAAATGPITIGLMIGYLPTLYSAFSRREMEVTKLSWLAGEPNWGPELLARQATLDTLDELPDLWREWTTWAADVSESHTTYPVLVTVRSTRPSRNWAVALLAVMDGAALQLALMPELPQGKARMLLREGIQCLRALEVVLLADALHLQEMHREPHSAERPVTLTRADFDRGVQRIREAGAPITCDGDEAWDIFQPWRMRYEDWAYALCKAIDAVPTWWSGDRFPATAPLPTPELGPLVAMGPIESRVRSRKKPRDGAPKADERAD